MKTYNNQKGNLLIITSGIAACLITTSLFLLNFIFKHSQTIEKNTNTLKCSNLAEAGIHRTIRFIREQNLPDQALFANVPPFANGEGNFTINRFNGQTIYSSTGGLADKNIHVKIEDNIPMPNYYTITASASVDDNNIESKAIVYREPVSFIPSYVTVSKNSTALFNNNLTINGDVHSDNNIYSWGYTPTINGKAEADSIESSIKVFGDKIMPTENIDTLYPGIYTSPAAPTIIAPEPALQVPVLSSMPKNAHEVESQAGYHTNITDYESVAQWKYGTGSDVHHPSPNLVWNGSTLTIKGNFSLSAQPGNGILYVDGDIYFNPTANIVKVTGQGALATTGNIDTEMYKTPQLDFLPSTQPGYGVTMIATNIILTKYSQNEVICRGPIFAREKVNYFGQGDDSGESNGFKLLSGEIRALEWIKITSNYSILINGNLVSGSLYLYSYATTDNQSFIINGQLRAYLFEFQRHALCIKRYPSNLIKNFTFKVNGSIRTKARIRMWMPDLKNSSFEINAPIEVSGTDSNGQCAISLEFLCDNVKFNAPIYAKDDAIQIYLGGTSSDTLKPVIFSSNCDIRTGKSINIISNVKRIEVYSKWNAENEIYLKGSEEIIFDSPSDIRVNASTINESIYWWFDGRIEMKPGSKIHSLKSVSIRLNSPNFIGLESNFQGEIYSGITGGNGIVIRTKNQNLRVNGSGINPKGCLFLCTNTKGDMYCENLKAGENIIFGETGETVPFCYGNIYVNNVHCGGKFADCLYPNQDILNYTYNFTGTIKAVGNISFNGGHININAGLNAGDRVNIEPSNVHLGATCIMTGCIVAKNGIDIKKGTKQITWNEQAYKNLGFNKSIKFEPKVTSWIK